GFEHDAMSAAPTKIKRATNLCPCLLIEILLSHSLWPAAPFARALGKFGVRYMSGWGNWNEQVGHLNFHGFFALAYLSSGVFDFEFAATRNHRAAAPLPSSSDLHDRGLVA